MIFSLPSRLQIFGHPETKKIQKCQNKRNKNWNLISTQNNTEIIETLASWVHWILGVVRKRRAGEAATEVDIMEAMEIKKLKNELDYVKKVLIKEYWCKLIYKGGYEENGETYKRTAFNFFNFGWSKPCMYFCQYW